MPGQDLQNQKVDFLTTKVVDNRGRQIKNGGDATDAQDFLTLAQLRNISLNVTTQTITYKDGTGTNQTITVVTAVSLKGVV